MVEQFGKLDILVNNAAVGGGGLLDGEPVDEAAVERQLAVNYTERGGRDPGGVAVAARWRADRQHQLGCGHPGGFPGDGVLHGHEVGP
ncbi:hypothetical protein [Actinomadura madurae]|uniref:hypothetical protein n=1 Tax=Actinomadura madurae TaxID=1993 RepID=UPI0020D22E96|nr:hypothetical protein [Actinomadura madurae]